MNDSISVRECKAFIIKLMRKYNSAMSLKFIIQQANFAFTTNDIDGSIENAFYFLKIEHVIKNIMPPMLDTIKDLSRFYIIDEEAMQLFLKNGRKAQILGILSKAAVGVSYEHLSELTKDWEPYESGKGDSLKDQLNDLEYDDQIVSTFLRDEPKQVKYLLNYKGDK